MLPTDEPETPALDPLAGPPVAAPETPLAGSPVAAPEEPPIVRLAAELFGARVVNVQRKDRSDGNG